MQAFSMRDFNFKSNSIVIFIYVYKNLTHFPVQNLLELDFEGKTPGKVPGKIAGKIPGKLMESVGKFQDILLEKLL